MVRPYKKVAQMYLGSYAVSWFGEPPHEQPWVVHNTNLEDQDEIRMEGFTNLACGNTPLYATANRLYFKVGSGSAKPVQEVFGLMRGVEEIHKEARRCRTSRLCRPGNRCNYGEPSGRVGTGR